MKPLSLAIPYDWPLHESHPNHMLPFMGGWIEKRGGSSLDN
jgi:hypothetical protein